MLLRVACIALLLSIAAVPSLGVGTAAAGVPRAEAAAAAPGTALAPGPPAAPRPFRPLLRPPITVAVDTDEHVVGLSFDDGPDPRWTPAVLDALRAADARATFFVTGESARAHPELLRAVVAAGHEVANHTDTHPRLEDLTPATVLEELHRADASIAGAGVPRAPLFRPPRGRYDAASLRAVESAGLRSVGWTVCLERWIRREGLVGGVAATLAHTRDGAVIVAHDGGIPDRSSTIVALPVLLAELRHRGYRLVTVTELLRLGPPVAGVPGFADAVSPTELAG